MSHSSRGGVCHCKITDAMARSVMPERWKTLQLSFMLQHNIQYSRSCPSILRCSMSIRTWQHTKLKHPDGQQPSRASSKYQASHKRQPAAANVFSHASRSSWHNVATLIPKVHICWYCFGTPYHVEVACPQDSNQGTVALHIQLLDVSHEAPQPGLGIQWVGPPHAVSPVPFEPV